MTAIYWTLILAIRYPRRALRSLIQDRRTGVTTWQWVQANRPLTDREARP